MERSLSFNNLEIPFIKTQTDSDLEVFETEKSTPKTLDGTNYERIQSRRESFVFYSPRPVNELDAADTMIQKVYKSFRTRKYLDDCAIVIEELWRKSLDDAAPKPVNELDAAAIMIQKVYKKRSMKPDTDIQKTQSIN